MASPAPASATTAAQEQAVIHAAQAAVLVESANLDDGQHPTVCGYDFNQGVDYAALFRSYLTSGFQATATALAIAEIQRMLDWRLSDEPVLPEDPEELQTEAQRREVRCKIFLGYTSNLISSGLRETLRFLVQHRYVHCVVSTAGGIEEDLIKCLGKTYVGDFHLAGKALRMKGLNRIGNLLVPNDNYCRFEEWVLPIFDAMLEEQKTQGIIWTPSKLIHRLGKEINDPTSVAYWCYRNDIPVFSPAITDGSLGDMLYFHSYKNPGLIIDINQDIRAMNNQATFARKTGMIILGGGLVKHHICNANLMRNGADFSVFVNTGQEYDGSDAGARPDEAVSWGKIRMTANPVKVYADATVVFPIIVAETFAKHHAAQQKEKQASNPGDAATAAS
ncbi:hypothetical protein CXG81DRAFT_26644 [Caulochytrium protostelioides]|uniref:deoxyhypusine synthase n=1 Tax=Caulochytrium protostelioides TaxID=1555241 RepID=A0A4P9X656_9FUNG|nr:hypothetical protein CXG81DRAFT_26644 [Caulochytrium protostelioides]|eukprot:RKP00656.1 hypothetical protein CXG81DRAFT_26644 [Caulochytrium protostelioides]